MNLRPLHHATLVALLSVATVAVAQAPSGAGAASGASAVASPGANATSPGPSAADDTTSSAHARRAGTPSAKRTHRTHASAATGGSGDARYDAALRQCVEGPAASRESCIDRAIDQHGR